MIRRLAAGMGVALALLLAAARRGVVPATREAVAAADHRA